MSINQGQFLDTIWGTDDVGGTVFVKCRDPKADSQKWQSAHALWPSRKQAVLDYIAKFDAMGWDVYITPAMFSDPDGGATKKNFLGSHVLWADFDGNAPREWDAKPLVHDRDGQTLTAVVPEPTLFVQSSREGNQHVYWRLDDFNTDLDFIEGANKSIAYHYSADLSGWDCVQLLRPPGTTNNKHNLPVTIVRGNTETQHLSSHFKVLPPAGQFIYDMVDTENLPPVERLLARYPWDDEHYDLFKKEIEKGDRSSALMRLGYFCAEADMSEAEIFAIVEDADRRWGKFTHRLDRKKQLATIVTKAKDKHPEGVRNLNFAGLLGKQVTAREVPTSDTDIESMMNWVIEVEWMIPDLLEKGGFGMVASKPGIGKTQFSLQLGIQVAIGEDFLIWKIDRSAKVLFLSLEMSTIALKKFIDAIGTRFTPEQFKQLKENFIIRDVGEGISLETPQGVQYLFDMLEKHHPELVIIDTFGKISHGEISEKTTRRVFNALLQARAQYGCSFWLVHHNRKANSDNKHPTELEDIYGSMYITAEMTSCLTLDVSKTDPNELTVRIVKNRMAEQEQNFKIYRDVNTLSFSREGVNNGEGIRNGPNMG